MSTVNIFGTCVSRDIFSSHENDGGYIINQLVSSISPFSVVEYVSNPMKHEFKEWIGSLTEIPNFVKRLITQDYCGEAMEYLRNKESEWCIIDMGIFRYRLSSLATNPNDFFNGGYFTTALLNKIRPHKEMYDKVVSEILACDIVDPLEWQDCVFYEKIDEFVQLIRESYDDSQIILIELKNVNQYIDNNNISMEKDVEYNSLGNIRMKKAFDYLRRKYEKFHVIEFPITTVGALKHRWGKHPLHYVQEYYDYGLEAINIISKRLSLDEEKMLLLQLKEEYSQRLWSVYQNSVCGFYSNIQNKLEEKKRWEAYSRYGMELVKRKNYQVEILSFFIKNGFRRCAIYSTCYPIKYLINALNSTVLIDYIIENNVSEYEGIKCYSRKETEYLKTDVIIITDIVNEESIRKRLAKLDMGIPYVGMYELIEENPD